MNRQIFSLTALICKVCVLMHSPVCFAPLSPGLLTAASLPLSLNIRVRLASSSPQFSSPGSIRVFFITPQKNGSLKPPRPPCQRAADAPSRLMPSAKVSRRFGFQCVLAHAQRSSIPPGIQELADRHQLDRAAAGRGKRRTGQAERSGSKWSAKVLSRPPVVAPWLAAPIAVGYLRAGDWRRCASF
jgi:hypothetical protein